MYVKLGGVSVTADINQMKENDMVVVEPPPSKRLKADQGIGSDVKSSWKEWIRNSTNYTGSYLLWITLTHCTREATYVAHARVYKTFP